MTGYAKFVLKGGNVLQLQNVEVSEMDKIETALRMRYACITIKSLNGDRVDIAREGLVGAKFVPSAPQPATAATGAGTAKFLLRSQNGVLELAGVPESELDGVEVALRMKRACLTIKAANGDRVDIPTADLVGVIFER